jgi:hypothetical protein
MQMSDGIDGSRHAALSHDALKAGCTRQSTGPPGAGATDEKSPASIAPRDRQRPSNTHAKAAFSRKLRAKPLEMKRAHAAPPPSPLPWVAAISLQAALPGATTPPQTPIPVQHPDLLQQQLQVLQRDGGDSSTPATPPPPARAASQLLDTHTGSAVSSGSMAVEQRQAAVQQLFVDQLLQRTAASLSQTAAAMGYAGGTSNSAVSQATCHYAYAPAAPAHPTGSALQQGEWAVGHGASVLQDMMPEQQQLLLLQQSSSEVTSPPTACTGKDEQHSGIAAATLALLTASRQRQLQCCPDHGRTAAPPPLAATNCARTEPEAMEVASCARPLPPPPLPLDGLVGASSQAEELLGTIAVHVSPRAAAHMRSALLKHLQDAAVRAEAAGESFSVADVLCDAVSVLCTVVSKVCVMA